MGGSALSFTSDPHFVSSPNAPGKLPGVYPVILVWAKAGMAPRTINNIAVNNAIFLISSLSFHLFLVKD